jgi:penicillin-binding protein 1C
VKRRAGRIRGARRVGVALLAGAVAAPPLIVTAVWHAAPFPWEQLERWPTGPAVTDRHGTPMRRLVGADDQWRTPVALAEMSPWLIDATIAVEDERFARHPGVDPVAVVRAAVQNVRAGEIVSGASTITMQVCRMVDERPRTIVAKMIEAVRALQLEGRLTKDRILEAYLNIAPYGGNRRGVEAASAAYFGKRAADLSLDEAALLAGLPQSPEGHRPDRDPEAALRRRETVLRRMAEAGFIDEAQRRRAAAAPLRLATGAPPPRAAHAAWMALARRPDGGRTTIDLHLQSQVEGLAAERTRTLPPGADLAVVVVDIPTGEIRALVGSADAGDPVDGQVNGALARRSPGSALKPFIYATAFEARRLAPDSTVHDVPVTLSGWSPANFDRTFRGAVDVTEALRASLNVPAIHVAAQIGLSRCAGTMQAAGLGLGWRDVERAGLALAVGGVEVSLLELTNAYATIGRGGTCVPPRLFADEPVTRREALRQDTCAALDEILSAHRRVPAGTTGSWPEGTPWFMWKTGTSSGRRDAWAVGHNGRVAVGVWVGRFDGGGDEAFVGAEAAEPLLARIFGLAALCVLDAPPAAPGWTVGRPLLQPAAAAGVLAITSPRDGATFRALDGTAVVHPVATVDGPLHWFLDGAALAGGQPARLALGPGRHELRCVDEKGRAAVSRFVVR